MGPRAGLLGGWRLLTFKVGRLDVNGLGVGIWCATEAEVGAVTVVPRSLDQVRFGRRDERQRCAQVSRAHTSSPCTLPGSRSLLFHCGAFIEHLVLAGHCPARSPFLKMLSVYPGRRLGQPGVRAHGRSGLCSPEDGASPTPQVKRASRHLERRS